MANKQLWGDVGSWTDGLFGTNAADLASLANGSGQLGSGSITNGTNLDLYVDISMRLGSISPSGTLPYLAFYLLPLLDDGATYVDGATGATAANFPSSTYLVAQAVLRTTATATQNLMLRGIIMPPGTFKGFIVNNAGVSLAASSNNLKYRTYSEQNNG